MKLVATMDFSIKPVCYAGCLLFCMNTTLSADVLIWDFTADEQQVRNGPEADGSTNSPGTGTARLELDTTTNILSYDIAWDQMFGSMTKLHIHGAADETMSTPRHIVELLGPPTVPSELAAPSGSISGSFEVTTLEQPGYDPIPAIEIIDTLKSGDAYVNFHSTVFGMGEIRGNVGLPVPEPSGGMLAACGMFAIGVVRRKRLRRPTGTSLAN